MPLATLRSFAAFLLQILIAWCALPCVAQETVADKLDSTSEQRGYQFLTNKAYLPADFDQETFDLLWQNWPEELRKEAADATVEQRRQMTFDYYGLTPRPEDEKLPLQYVVGKDGAWRMNCFACHGGKVEGRVVPGLPNSLYLLHTLTEDVRVAKLLTGKKLTHMDLGSMAMPLGRTRGTTNAVMFGVALVAQREPDLTVKKLTRPPPMTHHDMDAPPWWHFKKKQKLYIDGFANKDARSLMQFMLVRENGPEQFKEWEPDFEDIYAYLESIEPPPYPGEIDNDLAASGERVFRKHCADCHGTYDADPAKETYPNRLVPIEEAGTDRVRLDALSPAARRRYGKTWFAHFGEQEIIADPGGYVAPPLDGIWASAPYFHNGSVPTLWHVLHSDQRPKIWRRTDNGYDHERIGLAIETFDKLPKEVNSARAARWYFDTRGPGKSAEGHTFPDDLNAEQKRAVLEYLKTL